jgi:hypothetical protein
MATLGGALACFALGLDGTTCVTEDFAGTVYCLRYVEGSGQRQSGAVAWTAMPL